MLLPILTPGSRSRGERKPVGPLAAVLLALVLAGAATASAEQVLATVAGRPITSSQLESALASSPIATQFPSMDEDAQAGLRGEMLKRLINAELLYLEALDQRLEDSPELHRRMEEFRRGLYYQRFLARARDEAALDRDQQRLLKERFKNDPDALAAARSLGIAKRFEAAKAADLARLREQAGIQIHEDALTATAPDTVLASGEGLTIRRADLPELANSPSLTDTGRLRARLNERIDLELAARSVAPSDPGLAGQMEEYRRRLLAELLLDRKTEEWIPDDQVLRDYFAQHPELGRIPERREVGQLVTASRAEAEDLRRRVLAGESLFKLASQYSIDPYGRTHAGDMGWLREGSGMPEIEAALASLPDNRVSEVVQTPKGFHLLIITNRRPGRQMSYEAVHDRVRRAVLREHLTPYLAELGKRHAVELHLPDRMPAAQEQKPQRTTSPAG